MSMVALVADRRVNTLRTFCSNRAVSVRLPYRARTDNGYFGRGVANAVITRKGVTVRTRREHTIITTTLLCHPINE